MQDESYMITEGSRIKTVILCVLGRDDNVLSANVG